MDGPAVRDIVFATLRSYGIEPDPTGLDADVMTFGAAPEPVVELVAVIADGVVGSLMITPQANGVGHLSKFFVTADQRQRGIGRRLLAHGIAEARALGLRRLELETRAIYLEACHLYEATGWQRGPNPANSCDRTYYLELE